jgi:hypothetical protein
MILMTSKSKPNLSSYLFWDAHIDKVDFDQHASYIIEKVVTRGQFNDWQEIKRYYGIDTIKSLVVSIRSMPTRVTGFLSLVLDIPMENFRCYRNKPLRLRHWIY